MKYKYCLSNSYLTVKTLQTLQTPELNTLCSQMSLLQTRAATAIACFMYRISSITGNF